MYSAGSKSASRNGSMSNALGRRFVRPSELVRELEAGGLAAADITGVSYNPLADAWRLSRDTAVNYMVFAVKGGRIRPPDA